MKNNLKRTLEDKPLISIITVVFNGEKYLEKTIQSVIEQSYDNLEYIIIDGCSTDTTLNIIRKYEDKIDYWISERDQGIYDAMNKGIDVSNGKWLIFMNAGDVFFNYDTIKNIFLNKLYKNIDFIYGNVKVDYINFNKILKAKPLNSIWKGMIFSHQSCFINVAFHKKNRYSLNYKIADDFNLFFNAYLTNHKFFYIDEIFSIVIANGLSDSNHLSVNLEKQKIVNNQEFNITYFLYYSFTHIIIILKRTFKLLLPIKVIDFLRKVL